MCRDSREGRGESAHSPSPMSSTDAFSPAGPRVREHYGSEPQPHHDHLARAERVPQALAYARLEGKSVPPLAQASVTDDDLASRTARTSSSRSTAPGRTTPLRPSRSAFSHRRTSRLAPYFRSCASRSLTYHRRTAVRSRFTLLNSAELEMTVPMLIQIDKLVQLIESPVFTCAFSASERPIIR